MDTPYLGFAHDVRRRFVEIEVEKVYIVQGWATTINRTEIY
jgi:hypothetical protein